MPPDVPFAVAPGFAGRDQPSQRGFGLQKPRLPASTFGTHSSIEPYWQSFETVTGSDIDHRTPGAVAA